MYNYFVVVNHPAHKEDVRLELTSPSTGDPNIPDRPVLCVDSMPGSLYNGLFVLTEDEANNLKNDFRITDVHRVPSEIGIEKKHFGYRTGTYDKSSITTANMSNWALSRCINTTNNFGSSTSTSSAYTFNLDGTGVDVILVDTGVESGHPEFAVNADGTGGSRVQNYNWTVHGYLSTPTGGFLGDYDGHGSNVASIIAGNTCGWAPGANIYSLRTVSGASNTDITTGATLGTLDELSCWQTIRAFHLAKPITSTGYRRPTVVNASYGHYATYGNWQSITYRGVTHAATTSSGLYGTIGINEGGDGTHDVRYPALDADVQSCIDAGVIVVGAAGNDCHKIDVPTGLDYSNYWTNNSNISYYYHQGASPSACPGVICVGAAGSTTPEHKIYFSSTGPRIDVFSPGNLIMGAWSSATDTTPAVHDPRNTAYYLNKISGTSQASPQVAGIVACLVQARPWMTATDVLSFLTAVAPKNQLDEFYYAKQGPSYTFISTGTYTNLSSLQGAVNGYLYMPFNLPNPLTIS
jgi:Subtilase family